MSAIPEIYWVSFSNSDTVEVYDIIDYKSELEKNEKEKEDQKIRTGSKDLNAFSLRFARTGFMKESLRSVNHSETITPPPELFFA